MDAKLIAETYYEVLKMDTHYISMRYHWDKNTIYDMTTQSRREYIEILTQYDQAEQEAMEKLNS